MRRNRESTNYVDKMLKLHLVLKDGDTEQFKHVKVEGVEKDGME